jgi:uncharacterized protein YyaL (SSP411 family)
LRIVAPATEKAPGGFGAALGATDRLLERAVEVAVVGDLAGARALIETAWSRYLPTRVMAAGPVGSRDPMLLKGKTTVDGTPTAFVCRDFVCQLPVSDPAALEDRLRSS